MVWYVLYVLYVLPEYLLLKYTNLLHVATIKPVFSFFSQIQSLGHGIFVSEIGISSVCVLS